MGEQADPNHREVMELHAECVQVTSGPTAERLKDKYQQKIADGEEQARQLKERHKDIKETHTTGLSQIDMMTDLIRLLQLKSDLKKGSGGGYAPAGPQAHMYDAGAANVLAL